MAPEKESKKSKDIKKIFSFPLFASYPEMKRRELPYLRFNLVSKTLIDETFTLKPDTKRVKRISERVKLDTSELQPRLK
jgi:hypothetical protein